MIDVSVMEKANEKVVSTFYDNFIYMLIYFGTLVYIYGYLEKSTRPENDITAMENQWMYLLFILFFSYFVIFLWSKGGSWKHRIFTFIIALFLLFYGIYYKSVATTNHSILSKSFILPYIFTILLFTLLTKVSTLRRYILDPLLSSVDTFNQVYEKLGGLLFSLYIIMIVYVIVFRQYNYNTPSSNTFQPLVLGPILVVSLFYFIAKFVIEMGMVKKYNMTNVMISLYLLFSIFVCFYIYTFIVSLQKLSKESPATLIEEKKREEAFEKAPFFEKYTSKYIVWVILGYLILLYWIRDIIQWGRGSAALYLFITIMLIYTSKVVVNTQSPAGGALSALYLVEWLLTTKLRWHSVSHLLDILFRGVEIRNKDAQRMPEMIVQG